MELRDYQTDFIKNLYDKFRNHNTVAGVAPTGAGKTVILSKICQDAVKFKRRVLILVDRDVLVPQTLSKLDAFGILLYTGCIKRGYPEDRHALIQVASLQTLRNRSWWKETEFNLVIFDEAHTTMWHKVGCEVLRTVNCKVIGLTATPYRLSKKETFLEKVSTWVSAPVPSVLQDMGALAPMRYFSYKKVDLKDVKTSCGDYSESDLAIAVNTTELIDHVFVEWNRLVKGKRTLAFCVNKAHAEAVADYFNSRGVKSAVVTDATPTKERDKLYKEIASGSLTLIASVNVLSIGFDVPSVEVGLGLRPTKSLSLFHQQVGRIMRPSEGKESGWWIDQAGNCLRLIVPEQIEDYDLRPAKDKPPEPAPMKACISDYLKDGEKGCNALNYGFAKVCKECGAEFKTRERKTIVSSFVELKVTPTSKARDYYQRRLRRCYTSNKDPGSAFYETKEKYNQTPLASWATGAVFGDNPTQDDYISYLRYLRRIQARSQKSDNWISAQFLREFTALPARDWILKELGKLELVR